MPAFQNKIRHLVGSKFVVTALQPERKTMKQYLRALTIALALSGSALPAIAQAYYPPVPPPRSEYVPAPPGRGYIWRHGYWHWNGRSYVWFRGAYVRRRPGYHHWVPGHWGRRGHWIRAHWR